jgi:hypothetical protein
VELVIFDCVYEPGEEGWILALRLMLSPGPWSAEDRREREALHLTIAA